MSKNIVNVSNLRKYHEGLRAMYINPMQEQINSFESGDKFLTELNEVKSIVDKNTNNINVNKSSINSIKTNVSALQNTVREIDEMKENTGMNFLDSLSSLFIEHDDVDACLENNGYIKFPNGLIIQWGSVGFDENSDTIDKLGYYKIPFPNYCLSHSVSVRGYDSNWDMIANSYPMDNTSFRVVVRNKNPHIWSAVYFIAIGF